MLEKFCPRCRRTRLVQYFYPNRGRKDGLTSWCRACQILWRRLRRASGVDNSTEDQLARRALIRTAEELDRFDREEQERERRLLARDLPEIQGRLERMRSLKRLLCGEIPTEHELELMGLESFDARARQRQRRA